MRLTLELPPTPSAPAAARRVVEAWATDHAPMDAHRLTFLVCALVADAVEGAQDEGERVVVELLGGGDGRLHGSVRERRIAAQLAAAADGAAAIGGPEQQLPVVEALAEAWGVDEDAMRVWFVLGG